MTENHSKQVSWKIHQSRLANGTSRRSIFDLRGKISSWQQRKLDFLRVPPHSCRFLSKVVRLHVPGLLIVPSRQDNRADRIFPFPPYPADSRPVLRASRCLAIVVLLLSLRVCEDKLIKGNACFDFWSNRNLTGRKLFLSEHRAQEEQYFVVLSGRD